MLRPTTESLSALPTARLPWRISELLHDIVYGDLFKGGASSCMCSSPPRDYHRQHVPVSGRVIEAKIIPAICYLQVVAKLELAVTADR
ncbi:hypothetical protein M422DRAFT_263877 [Sphaerobolus stellatus SS14]|uniref:Uncharacterized protein n=1 Tax=Sphaerobolus stellatus (strain SS14) TaxID=990650 RepID=A0A0C9V9V0_SPHS4|nr:hypothetical protein M422DRAFT_263877 [Sphaerobolus stellatus SS14]